MRSTFAFRVVCEDSEKWVKWPISMRSVIHSQENKSMTFIRDIAVEQADLYVQLDPQCLGRWWWWCTWRGSGWAPELLVDKKKFELFPIKLQSYEAPDFHGFSTVRVKKEHHRTAQKRWRDVALCESGICWSGYKPFSYRLVCVGSWGYPSASAANLLASKYTSWLLLCC